VARTDASAADNSLALPPCSSSATRICCLVARSTELACRIRASIPWLTFVRLLSCPEDCLRSERKEGRGLVRADRRGPRRPRTRAARPPRRRRGSPAPHGQAHGASTPPKWSGVSSGRDPDGSTTRWGNRPAAARWPWVGRCRPRAACPVLTAAAGRSSRAARACAGTSSADSVGLPGTLVVSCTVSAVRALAPWAARVARSSWMLAPAPEWEPARVRATQGVVTRPGPQWRPGGRRRRRRVAPHA